MLLGEEGSTSETGGCEFANDSFRDLGMVKVRTVMVETFQSGERRRYQRRDRQELQSASVEVMTILEVIRRHWTQKRQDVKEAEIRGWMLMGTLKWQKSDHLPPNDVGLGPRDEVRECAVSL